MKYNTTAHGRQSYTVSVKKEAPAVSHKVAVFEEVDTMSILINLPSKPTVNCGLELVNCQRKACRAIRCYI